MALRISQTWVAVLTGETGKLRASQTCVSVLTGEAGKLRVTQTWVSVLVPALAFVIEDILSFTEEAHSSLMTPIVGQTLSFSETVGQNQYTPSVSNDLDMEDTVHVNMASLSVSQELPFTHSTSGVLTAQSLSSDLDLIDVAGFAGGQIRHLTTSNFLAMEDEVEVHYGVANVSIEDTLAGDGIVTTLLQDAVNLVWSPDIEHELVMTDEVLRVYAASNTLELIDTVAYARGALVEDVLEIEDEVFVNQVLQREIEDDLGVEDFVTYFIEKDDTECTYSPFLGAGSPVSPTAPTLGTATLTLTYPYISPTSTLVLRNPVFGNTEKHEFTRIARQTRGGTLEVFADPDWSKTKVLSLEINDLTQVQTDEFLDFLGDSLGREIGLLDWENRQWRGLIITPDAEVTDQGKTCRKTISFEFEGVLA